MFATRCSLGAVAAHEQPPGERSSSPGHEGLRCAHLGTYRVVYRIDEENRVVVILAVHLRRDVYGVAQ